MEYKRRNKEDYVFEDVEPNMPDIDLEELGIIQDKLEAFTSGRSNNGLTVEETEQFLDWVIYNARSFATKGTDESILTASMAGECAPTQAINKALLSKLGLDVRAFNTSDCIGEIPMSEQDVEKYKNLGGSRAVRHSIALVNIPVINKDGNTVMGKFLLDPTFRQFCLKENCNEEKFDETKWEYYDAVAPHPAYFMQKENLTRLGETEEYATKSENLCKKLISDGYFYLSENNAKLYGDAFVRSSRRLEFQNESITMSGKEYIYNFENNPMYILENRQDNIFTRLPKEIAQYEDGFFKKIIKFFKEKFSKKPKMLPSGEDNKYKENKLDVKLKGEDLEQYRIGEQQVLEQNEKGKNKDDNKNNEHDR